MLVYASWLNPTLPSDLRQNPLLRHSASTSEASQHHECR